MLDILNTIPESQNSASPLPLLVTPKQVCKMLDISNATLWRLTHNDPNFPKKIAITAKKSVFKYSDLCKWADSLNADASRNAITGREKEGVKKYDR